MHTRDLIKTHEQRKETKTKNASAPKVKWKHVQHPGQAHVSNSIEQFCKCDIIYMYIKGSCVGERLSPRDLM